MDHHYFAINGLIRLHCICVLVLGRAMLSPQWMVRAIVDGTRPLPLVANFLTQVSLSAFRNADDWPADWTFRTGSDDDDTHHRLVEMALLAS